MVFDRNGEQVNWESPIPVIKYKSLEDTGCVEHGFSTRIGGVSEGVYRSMNLSYTRGDDPKKVDRNFEIFCNQIHMNWRDVVSTDQTHTANVRCVTKEDAGHGIIKPRIYRDVDGQITNVPELPLVSYHADCVPLFFVDPVHKAIGLSHSGWKGTVGRIGENTVKEMSAHFHSKADEIVAVIGPSICQSCYEVSEDVAEHFLHGFDVTDQLIYEKENHKYQLNLWEANRQILIQAGLRPENITVTQLCTCCHPDILWSHRYTGEHRGSLAAFLSLKSLD